MDRNQKNEVVYRLERYRSKLMEHNDCVQEYKLMIPSGTQTLTDMPHGQSDTFEPERWAAKRESVLSRVKRLKREVEEARQLLLDMLSGLGNVDQAVLIGRYVDRKTWDQISLALKKPRTTIVRKHDRAIKQIAERSF